MLISVRLRIHGDLLDVGNVTALLGVAPHLVRTKGEVNTTSTGKSVMAKTSRWEWYSEDPTKVLSVDEHLARLKAAFENVLDEFGRIPGVMRAWLDVNVVALNSASDSQVVFVMSHESVDTINKIGFPIEFSVYTLGPAD